MLFFFLNAIVIEITNIKVGVSRFCQNVLSFHIPQSEEYLYLEGLQWFVQWFTVLLSVQFGHFGA